MGFFGELYLRSTLPFLGARTTEREVKYLLKAFASLDVPGPLLDLGCGHGRHAAPLDARLRPERRVFGLELDELSLRHREPGLSAVRADMRSLPFSDRSLAGVYAWYSTPFIFDDPTHQALLQDLHRVLKPGGRLVLQTVPYEHLASQPTAEFDFELPGGGRVEEESVFDPVSGVDEGHRKVWLPEGTVLTGHYRIRYYPTPELIKLLENTGFAMAWVHGGLDGSPLDAHSAELILGVDAHHA